MAEISAYKVAASPHKSDNANTRRIMLDVLIALLPCLVAGVVFYGLWSLLLVAVCMVTCFASEQIFNPFFYRSGSVLVQRHSVIAT